MVYDWNFGRLLPYADALLGGIATTLSLSAIVIILGTVLGVIFGILLTNKTLKVFFYLLVDVLRALPLLVLLLFMYYLLTRQVVGFAVSSYWVAVVAMSLNLSAFTADIIRSAVENVPESLEEAGRALGMNRRQVTRYIVLPHIIREVVPGMTVLYIAMIKLSSLASVIQVSELVYEGKTIISEITRSLEVWVVVGLVYIIIVIPMTYALRYIESKISTEKKEGVLAQG